MKFSTKTVANQKEILKRRIGGELFTSVALDESAFSDGVCKAGNPISADGKVATSGNPPIGILLNDVYDENPNGTIVRAFASVNKANCEANAGITLDASIISALSNIVFE